MTEDFDGERLNVGGKKSTTPKEGASPRCDSCKYVMPSYTSSTGLRCGLEYARANALMKKLRKMDFYPVVKDDNACELWDLDESL